MIIDIDKKLFEDIKLRMQKTNKTIFKELDKIKEMENIQNTHSSMLVARNRKTELKKEQIKKAILELKKEKIKVSKYQVHIKTKIAYLTINKYYDDILNTIN